MAPSLSNCPYCGQLNSHQLTHCLDCRKELPWAETVRDQKATEQSGSGILDDDFKWSSPAAEGQVPTGPTSTQGALHFCSKCHSRVSRSDNHCPNCGADWRATTHDAPSFLTAFLGFLFWPGGLLIWILQHDSHPHRAASAGRGALVGIFVGFVLGLIGYYYQLSVLQNSPGEYYWIPIKILR